MNTRDWGNPPAVFDIDGPCFDLKKIMSKCYPFTPVALRFNDTVFELQLVGWPGNERYREAHATPPTPFEPFPDLHEIMRQMQQSKD